MQVIKNKNIFMIIVLILIPILSSCSKPLSESIIGHWVKYEQNGKKVEGKGFFEFFSDSTVIMNPSDNPKENFQGKYTLSEDGRIKIDILINNEQLIIVGSASLTDEDNLHLKLENVGETKWKKILAQ